MRPEIDYKDTITLVFTTVDEYGADVIDDELEAHGLVVMNTGTSHGDNQDAITSDAQIYIDPSDAAVLANHYRLEGSLARIDVFGGPAQDNWYKVVKVDIYRAHLLDNVIDNIVLSLNKTGDIGYVS
jgi:hypothetical protein